MKHFSMIVAAGLAFLSTTACNKSALDEPPHVTSAVPSKNKLFLDVHELGKGNVTRAAVAEAHAKDLAVEGKYGVDFKAYWVDEQEGKIYCLVEAPNAEATTAVHKEAHGLVAKQILEVSPAH